MMLGVLGCVAMMGFAMLVLPPLARRVRQTSWVSGLIARMRSQSAIDRVLSWAEEERPDLHAITAPDGTVTILFTDIEDSTGLKRR